MIIELNKKNRSKNFYKTDFHGGKSNENTYTSIYNKEQQNAMITTAKYYLNPTSDSFLTITRYYSPPRAWSSLSSPLSRD